MTQLTCRTQHLSLNHMKFYFQNKSDSPQENLPIVTHQPAIDKILCVILYLGFLTSYKAFIKSNLISRLSTNVLLTLKLAAYVCSIWVGNALDSKISLHWRHNGHDSVSNHQPYDCLLNRLFRRRSKEISKLRVTGLCARNSSRTGEFPAQIASKADNVSIWWRHHVLPELTVSKVVDTAWHN